MEWMEWQTTTTFTDAKVVYIKLLDGRRINVRVAGSKTEYRRLKESPVVGSRTRVEPASGSRCLSLLCLVLLGSHRNVCVITWNYPITNDFSD